MSRRAWLTPVLVCAAAVGVHAYFQVPKGKYRPRQKPKKKKPNKAQGKAQIRPAKLQRNRSTAEALRGGSEP